DQRRQLYFATVTKLRRLESRVRQFFGSVLGEFFGSVIRQFSGSVLEELFRSIVREFPRSIVGQLPGWKARLKHDWRRKSGLRTRYAVRGADRGRCSQSDGYAASCV